MPRKQVGQIDADLLARVDAARGDVPRTRFVERALEAALAVHGGGGVGHALAALEGEPEAAEPPARPLERAALTGSSTVQGRPAVSSSVRPAIPKKEK